MVDDAKNYDQPEPSIKFSYDSAIWSNVCGWPLWFFIGWLAWILGGSIEEQWTNILLFVIGSLLGWAVGMYFAPIHDIESTRFVSIGQAVSAFVSGYVLSKFDRFLETVLFSQSDVVSSSWVRLGITFSAFLVIAIIVYSSRTYWKVRPK
jgi:hypothetical protein